MAENDVESKIEELLSVSPDGLQSEEIASSLNLTRHTVAKYLEILRARNRVRYRKVGRTKLWKTASADVRVRPLTREDVEDVIGIMAGLSRGPAPEAEGSRDYLRETVERHIDRNEPLMNIGAELDGRLVGFVMGEVRAWEFGQREKTGWIEVLGVHPRYMGTGVGRQLGQRLIGVFKRRGVRAVHTSVQWKSGDLLAFFGDLGFDRSDFITLELPVKRRR